jgi:hypothetical protein
MDKRRVILAACLVAASVLFVTAGLMVNADHALSPPSRVLACVADDGDSRTDGQGPSIGGNPGASEDPQCEPAATGKSGAVVVPEPKTAAMLVGGMIWVMLYRIRRSWQ